MHCSRWRTGGALGDPESLGFRVFGHFIFVQGEYESYFISAKSTKFSGSWILPLVHLGDKF